MSAKDKIDTRQINKLQREIQQLQKELTLQRKEEDIIKQYKMKEGDYQVLITIYEANQLQPRGTNFWLFQTHKTACDAFVQIKVRDQVKTSSVREETNNPIFDEQFIFKFQNLSLQELDLSNISITVYDKKTFILSDSLLGSFELDWTNVYFKRNHEIYRGWLMLSDPEDVIQGVMGYLLVNIAVLGPDDKVTVHDSAFIKDPLTTMEDTVTMPKLQLIDYAISIQIYRAQNLVPLDEFSGNVDAYVVAKFSGNKVQTSFVTSGVNPEWNELLKIGTGVPTKSRYITLEVRNQNTFDKDDIIGVIKIPLISLKEESQPRWGHLYGPPIDGKDQQPYNEASKMQVYGQDIGSHYRGRLMYKVTGHKDMLTKNKRSKINFQFPYKPTPVVPLKSYVLRTQFLQGFSLPLNQQCYIHVCIGQYFLLSRAYGHHKDNYLQFYDSFPDKKLQLPQDITQIPDLIIYFAKGKKEKDRISFIRIKADTLVSEFMISPMKIYQLKPDLSLGLIKPGKDSGGFITARIHLFKSKPPVSTDIRQQFGTKTKFILKTFLYQGEGFPPANQTGQCDPFVTFNFLGKKAVSDVIWSTYNPIWNQIIDIEVQIQDLLKVRLEKGMICQAFDKQTMLDNYIGEFLVKFSSDMRRTFKDGNGVEVQFIYKKPQWLPVLNDFVDIGDKCFGKILMTFALFRKQDYDKIQSEALSKINFKTNEKMLQLFLIGARDIKIKGGYLSNQKIFIETNIPTAASKIEQQKKDSASERPKAITSSRKSNANSVSGSYSRTGSLKQGSKKSKQLSQKNEDKKKMVSLYKRTEEYMLKNNSAQINEMHEFYLSLPKNKGLIPFGEFKLYRHHLSSQFIGFNCINLYKILPKLLQDQDEAKKKIEEQQSEQTILDVEKLQQQLDIVRERKKKLEEGYQKKKKKFQKVQDLMVPNELGGKNFGFIKDEERKIQFDNLLKNFNSKYENDPQYDYVKELQNQKDQELKSQSLSKLNSIPPSEIMSNSQMSNNPPMMIKDRGEEEQQQMLSPSKKDLFEKQQKMEERVESGKPLSGQKQKNGNIFENMKNQFQEKENKQSNKTSRQMSRRQKQIEHAKYMNDPKSLLDDRNDLQNRFFNESKSSTEITNFSQNSLDQGNKVLQNFNINENDEIEEMKYSEKAIKYKDVQEAIKQEQKFTKEAMERQANFKYAAAVKLSLFQWQRGKNDEDRETYQDYDTDPEQDLDIIPEWYKGRKILSTDLQDLIQSKKKIVSLPIYRGGQKIKKLQIRKKQKIATLKFVAISETSQIAKQKELYYKKLLKPKQFVCRVYVLKGKSLISNFQGKPTTYLKFESRGITYDLKPRTLAKQCLNPEYYICQEVPMELPGASNVRISVMEIDGVLGTLTPKILGYTDVDIQERYFMKKWHLFTGKKPIQLRNLYSEYGSGTQGRLEVWIDLVEKKNWLSMPPYKIHPPPFDDFQLRVIVWSTKDCVYKNQAFESNDIYVRAMVGTSPAQETDTHWACRSVGNFNYRFKYKVAYPPKPEDMYSDTYTVQIWDRDLIGYNNLIGQTRVNLNKIHKIIQKAVKRKRPVKGAMKIKEKGLLVTDRMWFDVYNHKVKDQFGQLQSQGKVQLSFELVPLNTAENDLKNGHGRSEPNVYPTLQEPAGRLSFNFFHPLDFFKQLLGPNLYNSCCMKLCCCLGILVVLVLGYFIIGQLIASAIIP